VIEDVKPGVNKVIFFHFQVNEERRSIFVVNGDGYWMLIRMKVVTAFE